MNITLRGSEYHVSLLYAVIFAALLASPWLAASAGAADVPTGTVQFKIVDAETGENIGGLIWHGGQVVLDLSVQDTIAWPVGSDSVQATSGRYGDFAFKRYPEAVWGTEFEVDVAQGETSIVIVEMPPPAQVRFRAVDDRTGLPLPMVDIAQLRSRLMPLAPIITTDGWITTEVHPDPASSLHIGIEDRTVLLKLEALVAGELLEIVDEVRVPSPPLFRGTVTDPTGSPVAGVRVEIVRGSSDASATEIFQTTTTDDNGYYEVEPSVDHWRAEFLPPVDRPDLGAFGINDRDSTPRWMTSWRFEAVDVSLPRGQWRPLDIRRTRPTASNPITVAAREVGSGGGINILWSEASDAIAQFEVRNASGVLVDIHPSMVPDGFVPKGCGSCSSNHQTTLGPWGYQVQLWKQKVTLSFYEDTKPIFLDPPASSSAPHRFTISPHDGCVVDAVVELRWFVGELGPRPIETTTPPSSLPVDVTFDDNSPTGYTYRVIVEGADPVLFGFNSVPGAADWRIGTGAPACARVGYAVVTAAGDVFEFGDVEHKGDATATTSPATAIELSPSGNGYWVLAEDGAVDAFGDAADFGSVGSEVFRSNERPTTLASTPSGNGYWIITTAGRVVTFGDAETFGDLINFELAGEIIAAAATPSGNGYYLVGADGGIFAFGDAKFVESIPGVLPGVRLNKPIVGLTPDPDGDGYWLVAADGGVFAFRSPFRGSIPGVLPLGSVLAAAINGMVPYGNGYLLVAGDGGVFNFSDLVFSGSLGDVDLDAPIVAISAL